jgi:hypothetical protein
VAVYYPIPITLRCLTFRYFWFLVAQPPSILPPFYYIMSNFSKNFFLVTEVEGGRGGAIIIVPTIPGHSLWCQIVVPPLPFFGAKNFSNS